MSVYHCQVCGKPFDMAEKLADFALAAHEKDHRAMKPERLLVLRGGVWHCAMCSHLFGDSREMATIGMISHMKEHGIRPASSAPDVTRGGRADRSSGFSGRLADLAGDAADLAGEMVERIIRSISD